MQGVLNTQYSFRRGALACQLRAALSALVFDKTLMVSTADMAGFSAGTVQTMMSVDADRVVNMFSWMHELWSLPLQIVVALGLLYTQACAHIRSACFTRMTEGQLLQSRIMHERTALLWHGGKYSGAAFSMHA